MTKSSWVRLAVFLTAALLSAANAKSATTILVDDDKVQCPTASFSTIQAAIDSASPGERIRICAGVYHEQLTIDKSVTLAADNNVVLMPVGMTANATGLTVADQIAAAIFVKNATAVEIEGFFIDGSGNAITECGPRLIGILFENASGEVTHNAVQHFRLSPTLPGCQSGNGIEVETSSGATSNVDIVDNNVSDYQKNGITANETGTNVTIDSNAVAGIGPTTGAAQNGIQIGFGAKGSITNNNVVDHIWSPCASLDQCSTNAAGILVFQSNSIQVTGNSVGSNQIGIFIGGNTSQISSNTVFNSPVLDGIAIVGNNNNILVNAIKGSDEASVFVQGSNNQILSNEFLSAPAGVLFAPHSPGNVHQGNQFFAVLVSVTTETSPAAIVSNLKSNAVTASSEKQSGAATGTSGHQVSPSR